MKSFFIISFALFLSFLSIFKVHAGVLATEETIFIGKNNLFHPALETAANNETGLGAAVTYILTGNDSLTITVKTSILRSVTGAVEQLPEAKGFFHDTSSRALYESLLMFDLIPESVVFTEVEIERVQTYMKYVLDHYLNSKFYPWVDERWCLGATAMRIVASCALYALNFPEDPDIKRYLEHSRLYLEKNLADSIDDFGAWVTDSPGYTDDALEYVIITAKAFKNAEIADYFSHPRLNNLLLYEMHLLPPQQCPLVQGKIMIAGTGETDSSENHGGTAIIAASDIMAYYPNTASSLMWYWNQCGNPSNPLGLLFIDTSIQPLAPVVKSMYVGGGMAVLRDLIGTIEESAVFVSFGDAEGTPDRDRHDYSDSGNFSFIWHGIPLFGQNMFWNDKCSKELVNRASWRHNLVLYSGAGDIPVIPEVLYNKIPVKPDITGTKTVPADMYPDGISQFLSTELVDYVAGQIRLDNHDLPAAAHYRHFLFLKPDALLVWDQIESSFPLEWNLWIPAENTWAENNVLHVHTRQNIDLEVYFAGDSSLDFSSNRPPANMVWEWPLILRASYGEGTIMFSTLDFISQALTDSSTFARDLLRNMLLHDGQPSLIGTITGNTLLGDLLTRLRIPHELLTYEEMLEADLSHYSKLIIGDFTSSAGERSLYDYSWKINDYISRGGSVIMVCSVPEKWMPGNVKGPGVIPITLAVSECYVTLDGINVKPKLYPDPIWEKPIPISSNSIFNWINESTSAQSGFEGIQKESLKRKAFIPSAWSDAWEILATCHTAIPVNTFKDEQNREPVRIRVKHPASKDFFTLFLPRKIGEPYQFEVVRMERDLISFADQETTWEISAGKTSWTDANLAVQIAKIEGRELYAFDCTFIRIGEKELRATSPMSIYYSERDHSGVIMTASSNIITFSKSKMKLHGGEIRFSDLWGEIKLDRLTYITRLTVNDSKGDPVRWAKVYVDGRFVGATGIDGTLPVRWKGGSPAITVKFNRQESVNRLVPGDMQIVLAAQ